MKEIIKRLFLIILICFSFFLTDKVVNTINKNSKLMKKIEEVKDEYTIKEVSAIIDGDTIIPGTVGKEVDVNRSFNNMKEYNVFVEDYLVYNDIFPSFKLSDNKDKYIIKGNSSKKSVSVLLIIDDNNIDVLRGLENITLFINHNLLTIDNINKLKGNEIYTYGNNGVYNKRLLINDNTLINNLANNNSMYCLTKEKNSDVLNVCMDSDMNTIVPSIIGSYSDIKNNLSNGSIILVNNVNNVSSIVKYIESKGYDIVPLSILLTE